MAFSVYGKKSNSDLYEDLQMSEDLGLNTGRKQQFTEKGKQYELEMALSAYSQSKNRLDKLMKEATLNGESFNADERDNVKCRLNKELQVLSGAYSRLHNICHGEPQLLETRRAEFVRLSQDCECLLAKLGNSRGVKKMCKWRRVV